MAAPFAAALPKFALLAVGPLGETGPPDTRLAFTRFNPGCTQELMNTTTDKALGTRTHGLTGTVPNQRRVAPSASLRPVYSEWGALLPWILCGTPSGTSYPLGPREVSRIVSHHDTQRVWTMSGVVVSQATFSASAGGALQLDLQMAGVDYSTASGGFPAGLAAPTGVPFLMTDLSLTVAGTTPVNCQSARLTVDNAVQADRYFYGATNAGPVATDRTVTVELVLPYGLHSALWAAGAGDAGAHVALSFVRNGKTLTFDMPSVRAVAPAIESNVPSETMMTWSGQAVSDTADGELTVTLTA